MIYPSYFDGNRILRISSFVMFLSAYLLTIVIATEVELTVTSQIFKLGTETAPIEVSVIFPEEKTEFSLEGDNPDMVTFRILSDSDLSINFQTILTESNSVVSIPVNNVSFLHSMSLIAGRKSTLEPLSWDNGQDGAFVGSFTVTVESYTVGGIVKSLHDKPLDHRQRISKVVFTPKALSGGVATVPILPCVGTNAPLLLDSDLTIQNSVCFSLPEALPMNSEDDKITLQVRMICQPTLDTSNEDRYCSDNNLLWSVYLVIPDEADPTDLSKAKLSSNPIGSTDSSTTVPIVLTGKDKEKGSHQFRLVLKNLLEDDSSFTGSRPVAIEISHPGDITFIQPGPSAPQWIKDLPNTLQRHIWSLSVKDRVKPVLYLPMTEYGGRTFVVKRDNPSPGENSEEDIAIPADSVYQAAPWRPEVYFRSSFANATTMICHIERRRISEEYWLDKTAPKIALTDWRADKEVFGQFSGPRTACIDPTDPSTCPTNAARVAIAQENVSSTTMRNYLDFETSGTYEIKAVCSGFGGSSGVESSYESNIRIIKVLNPLVKIVFQPDTPDDLVYYPGDNVDMSIEFETAFPESDGTCNWKNSEHPGPNCMVKIIYKDVNGENIAPPFVFKALQADNSVVYGISKLRVPFFYELGEDDAEFDVYVVYDFGTSSPVHRFMFDVKPGISISTSYISQKYSKIVPVNSFYPGNEFGLKISATCQEESCAPCPVFFHLEAAEVLDQGEKPKIGVVITDHDSDALPLTKPKQIESTIVKFSIDASSQPGKLELIITPDVAPSCYNDGKKPKYVPKPFNFVVPVRKNSIKLFLGDGMGGIAKPEDPPLIKRGSKIPVVFELSENIVNARLSVNVKSDNVNKKTVYLVDDPVFMDDDNGILYRSTAILDSKFSAGPAQVLPVIVEAHYGSEDVVDDDTEPLEYSNYKQFGVEFIGFPIIVPSLTWNELHWSLKLLSFVAISIILCAIAWGGAFYWQKRTRHAMEIRYGLRDHEGHLIESDGECDQVELVDGDIFPPGNSSYELSSEAPKLYSKHD